MSRKTCPVPHPAQVRRTEHCGGASWSPWLPATMALSVSMSAMSFGRHGWPLRSFGYCSFIASMPCALIARTWKLSSVIAFLTKEPGGNSQSENRPSGWLNAPSDCRSK